METIVTPTLPNAYTRDLNTTTQTSSLSAVSWGAILAGGVAAAALSLIFLLLGTGLGMSAVSPWSDAGISIKTWGLSTILWVTLTSLVASAVGGYVAGRLRTRWLATDTDEVFFRDTAHGFLTWAISTILTAVLLTSAISGVIHGGIKAGVKLADSAMAGTAAAATAAVGTQIQSQEIPYFLDAVFRRDPAAVATETSAINQDSKAKVTRIFMNAIINGNFKGDGESANKPLATLPAEDLGYAGRLVAQQTGLSQQDAEKRVADGYAQLQTKMREAEIAAKTAADEARKASAYSALWLFVSLLIGAFVASFAATFGGRQRDLY